MRRFVVAGVLAFLFIGTVLAAPQKPLVDFSGPCRDAKGRLTLIEVKVGSWYERAYKPDGWYFVYQIANGSESRLRFMWYFTDPKGMVWFISGFLSEAVDNNFIPLNPNMVGGQVVVSVPPKTTKIFKVWQGPQFYPVEVDGMFLTLSHDLRGCVGGPVDSYFPKWPIVFER